MREITLWYRRGTENTYSYNHYEDGFSHNRSPEPITEAQEFWRRETWIRTHAWITPSYVVIDPMDFCGSSPNR